jgi:hypothetical protein
VEPAPRLSAAKKILPVVLLLAAVVIGIALAWIGFTPELVP